jgi:hypothetical protein
MPSFITLAATETKLLPRFVILTVYSKGVVLFREAVESLILVILHEIVPEMAGSGVRPSGIEYEQHPVWEVFCGH